MIAKCMDNSSHSMAASIRAFIGGLKIQDSSKNKLREDIKNFKMFLAETGLPVTDLNILNDYETWLSENGLKGVAGKMSVAKRFMLFMGAEEADVALTGGGVANDLASDMPFFTASEMNLCRLFSWNGEHNIRNRALVALILDSGITFKECAGILSHEIDSIGGRQLIVSVSDDRYAVFSYKTHRRIERFTDRRDDMKTFFGLSTNGIQAVWVEMLESIRLPLEKIYTLRRAWVNNAFFYGGLSAEHIATYFGISHAVVLAWLIGQPSDYHRLFDGVLWGKPPQKRPQNTADKLDRLMSNLL